MLGPTIKWFRERRGYNQGQFAELIDLAPNDVRQIEAGRREPSTPVLRKMCDVLNVPVSFIYLLADKTNDPVLRRCQRLVLKYL